MLDKKIWEFEEERMRDARELGKRYMEQQVEEGIKKGHQQGLEEGIEQGLEQGLEQGNERGREEGLEQSVLNIYKKNNEISFIADILSLPEEKVRGILEKHHCL